MNAVISKLMKRILVNAESERAAYMAYLRKTGLLSSERPGVVDIGWKANIQGALGDLIGRRTHGYYYATLPGAELWEAKGDCHRAYAGLSHHKTTRSAPVLFRQLTEFLSCHCSRSLVAMTGSDGDMSPVFRKEVGFKSRSALVRPIQNGAVQFARDFQDGFGDDIGQMIIDPSLAEAALASLLHKPSAIDARMFVGQGFEDAVGGIFRKFIISPSPRDPETRSVWPQGHRVIHAQAIRPGSKALTNKTEAAASAIMDPLKRRESLAAVARKDSPAEQANGSMSAIRRIEDLIIRRTVSEKKYRKYSRARPAFFDDARSPVVRLYGRLSARSMY